MTKIEQACRAMFKARFPSAAPEDIEFSWPAMKPEVYAVLESLRTPSEAMAEALDNANGVFGLVAWHAGIDAALKETP